MINFERVTEPNKAYDICLELAEGIKESVLKKSALETLEKYKTRFLTYKGSDFEHHNYEGGLIVHTCNVTLIARELGKFYEDKISMDLLIFCALTHDVGKLFDYNSGGEMAKELLGHIYEGASYIDGLLRRMYNADSIKVSGDYAHSVATQCVHCITSHKSSEGITEPEMFEAVIIENANKIESSLEQEITEETDEYIVFNTGKKFYKSCIDVTKS